MGAPMWRLVLCLFAAWVIVFLCLIKGIKSTGKVVYFTATFPYLVLVILLVRGATLDGAADGVYFYSYPDFSLLMESKVWINAATQIFFSLGPAYGGLITMSSYNKFNNNCLNDAVIVAVINCATSIFAGFVIFSIVGFVAHDLGVDVANVTDKGPGLAFIVYPEALVRMPAGPVFSVLFFFMLLTLGLDSQFVMLEVISTGIMDQYPITRRYKLFLNGSLCTFFFIVGLPFCAPGGFYWFTLLNDYAVGYSVLVLAVIETIVVSYVYGFGQFCADVEAMIGYKPNWYWKICCLALCPIFLVVVLIFSIYSYEKSSYRTYEFTPMAENLGLAACLLPIIIVPIFAIYTIIKFKLDERPLHHLRGPSPGYCPADARLKRSVTLDKRMKRRKKTLDHIANPESHDRLSNKLHGPIFLINLFSHFQPLHHLRGPSPGYCPADARLKRSVTLDKRMKRRKKTLDHIANPESHDRLSNKLHGPIFLVNYNPPTPEPSELGLPH